VMFSSKIFSTTLKVNKTTVKKSDEPRCSNIDLDQNKECTWRSTKLWYRMYQTKCEMVCRKWLYKYTINSTPLHLVRSTTMTTSHASPPSCTLQPYCGILQMHLGSIGPIRYWNLSLKKDIHSDKVKHSTLSELNHNEIFCLCNIFFLASRIDENSFGTRWMNNRTVFRFFWQPLILVKFFVLLQKHIINSHYQKIIWYKSQTEQQWNM
jgi:hypothetical protein